MSRYRQLVRWYHWVWAFPVMFFSLIIAFIHVCKRRVVYCGQIDAPVPLWKFEATEEYAEFLDKIPDDRVGGSAIVGNIWCFPFYVTVSASYLSKWQRRKISPGRLERTERHECRHAYQIFRYGVLFPVIYGCSFAWQFMVDKDIPNAKRMPGLMARAMRAYHNVGFEEEARAYETVPYEAWNNI